VYRGRSVRLQGTTIGDKYTRPEEGEAQPYLVHYILKGIWAVDGETNKEEICFGI
jgi:hypothetical protein